MDGGIFKRATALTGDIVSHRGVCGIVQRTTLRILETLTQRTIETVESFFLDFAVLLANDGRCFMIGPP